MLICGYGNVKKISQNLDDYYHHRGNYTYSYILSAVYITSSTISYEFGCKTLRRFKKFETV